MKTRVNQMMVLAFLSLVLFAVNAGANEKEAIVVSGLENIKETELEVESWMVNETYWSNLETNVALEESLEIESWMLDEANWSLYSFVIPVETEVNLMVEPWMTDMFNQNENAL